MIICPVCGEANGDSSLYCQSCAARLNVGAGSAVPEHTSVSYPHSPPRAAYTNSSAGSPPSFYSASTPSYIQPPYVVCSKFYYGDPYKTKYADILHVVAIVLASIYGALGLISFILSMGEDFALALLSLIIFCISGLVTFFLIDLNACTYRNGALTGRNTEALYYVLQQQGNDLKEQSGLLSSVSAGQNAMSEILRKEIASINASGDINACTQALEQLPQRLAEMLAPIITESVAAVAAGIPDAVRLAVQAQAAESTEDESEDKSEANDEPAAAAKDAPDAKDDRDSEAEPASVKVPVRQVGQTSSQRPRQVSAQQSSRNANQQSSTQQNTAQEPLPSAAPAAPALPSDDEDEEPVIVLYDPDLDPEPIPTPEPQPGDVPLETLIGPGGEL